MTTHQLDAMFASQDAPFAPVPAVHAEPLERLLAALHSRSVVFVLTAAEAAWDWMDGTRLYRCLQASLMEAAEATIWPLLHHTWAIALDMQAGANQPEQSLRIHSLRRALTQRLEAAWQRDNGMDSPPFADCDGFLLPVESAILCTEASRANDAPPVFTLTPIAPLRDMADMEDNIAELNALLHIIVNKQLHAQFQPIVTLRDGSIFGYEALIRGPKGGMLRRTSALYKAAEKARMVSWFDLACQEQCFALAARHGLRHHLFVNMEAEGLAFMDMHERPLAVRARESGLNPASIVIEITERQSVEDFPRLMHSLEALREQGFAIAIDDAGAGYNSLRAIAELRPDFVKVDRALTRNLDVNGEHRALLSALVSYARDIGTRVLAEGSETREELATLIDLGVTYGQGYLMGKPADTFRGVARETREFIQARHRQRVQMAAGRGVTIRELARPAKILGLDAPLADAVTAFYRNPSLTGVVVAEDGFARGLLMRQSVEHILDMARSVRMNDLAAGATVAQWMKTTLLCAGEEEAGVDVARQATMRSDLSLDADIVVVDTGGRCVSVLPMRVLMETVTTLQANRSRYADPLTGLPNRVALEQAVSERLESRELFALARVDLTGLESYNTAYGLPHGDSVIGALASILQEALQTQAEAGTFLAQTFLAHLGGDDFAMLLPPDKAAGVCEMAIKQFTRQLPRFYAPQQARSGVMEVAERNGNVRRVPLLACRIAVVTNRSRRFACPAQMLDEAQALLRQLKSQPNSPFAIDRVFPVEQRRTA